jgi:hypothetical protein
MPPPAPVPLGLNYTLACYYMPKPHDLAHQWVELEQHNSKNGIKPGGQRMPLLGYYRGDDPVTLDWQIKFAVDRGITVFVFDDYWTDQHDAPSYEGALNAFLQAQYRNSMQFSVALFSNNVADGTAATARARFLSTILPYYVAHYVTQPNFLLVDGKPAIHIGSLYAAFGGSTAPQIAATLAAADAYIASHTSFTGAYWIAGELASPTLDFANVHAAGFSAVHPYYVLPYLYPTPTFPFTSPLDPNATWDAGVPYASLTSASQSLHAQSFTAAAAAGSKFITSIAVDFDSRATWYQSTHLFFANGTDLDYWNLLHAVRDLVDANAASVPIATRTGLPIVGLGPWNEQMESTSVEPGWGVLSLSNGDPFFVSTAAALQFGAPASTTFYTAMPSGLGAASPALTDFTFDTDDERARWFDWAIRSELSPGTGGMLVRMDGSQDDLVAATSASTQGFSHVRVRVLPSGTVPLGSMLLRYRGSTYPAGSDQFGAAMSSGAVTDGLIQLPYSACTANADGSCDFLFDVTGWQGTLMALDLRFAGATGSPPLQFVVERVTLQP